MNEVGPAGSSTRPTSRQQARLRLHCQRPGDLVFQLPAAASGEDHQAAGRCRHHPGAARATAPSPGTRQLYRSTVESGEVSPPAETREPAGPPLDPQVVAIVEAQLGRRPRAIRQVAHTCTCGLVDVIETSPRLPDGTPFPTLFYLTCPRASKEIGRLEASGLMREMTDRLRTDPELAAKYQAADRGLPAPPRRAGCAARGAHRRRHAGPGEMPARAGRPQPGRRPGSQPVRRRGARA